MLADLAGHQMVVEEGRYYTCNRLQVWHTPVLLRPLSLPHDLGTQSPAGRGDLAQLGTLTNNPTVFL